jgi:hypothetical protein
MKQKKKFCNRNFFERAETASAKVPKIVAQTQKLKTK